MSKYELLYKKLLINNKSKVELLNRKDKPIEEFVKDKVQDNELCKLILENDKKIENKEIDELSFEEIMAKLILPHRAERFCDGAIHSFVESGDIKKCLKRLLNILENKI